MDILSLCTILSSICALIAVFVSIAAAKWKTSYKFLTAIFCMLMLAVPPIAYFRVISNNNVVGQFEWQWAGENWIGRLDITKENDTTYARIDLNRFSKSAYSDGEMELKRDHIADSYCNGKLFGDKNGFRLLLPVKKYPMDNDMTSDTAIITIDANLSPVEAYAGKVDYISKNGNRNSGDMIIVKYLSGARYD